MKNGWALPGFLLILTVLATACAERTTPTSLRSPTSTVTSTATPTATPTSTPTPTPTRTSVLGGGDTLTIRLEEIQRTPEVRFQGGDQAHYLLTPTSGDNELVMVRLTIWNTKTSTAIFTVDSEAAELRGLRAYEPLDVNASKVEVPQAHSSESKFARTHPALPEEPPSVLFLLGPVELPKDHLLAGWLVFEVPKGTGFRELKWQAGDTVYLRF